MMLHVLSVRLLSLRVCLSPVSLPLLPFLFTIFNVVTAEG